MMIAAVCCVRGAYSPPDMMGLDAWFLRDGEVWRQFQLCGPFPWNLDKTWPGLGMADRSPLPAVEQGIYLSSSRDLITWEDGGIILTVGPPGSWDGGKIYTGNIAKHEGRYYLFYTGIPEHPKPGRAPSAIGLAVSSDLTRWEKHPRNPVLLPDPFYYDPLGNWRDCSFHWDEVEKTWYAVVCATAKGEGPIEERACIGLAKSHDLIEWECLPPLVVEDKYTLGLENPFLFERNGTWYAGHSMYGRFYSEDWREAHDCEAPLGGVFYFMGGGLRGPFVAPVHNGLGTQPDPPLYAGQVIVAGQARLFMHRGPERWATALPKRVEFLPDRTMRLAYWPGTEKARRESLATCGSADVVLSREGEQAIEIGRPGLDCFFEAQLELKGGGAAALVLGDTFVLSVDAEAGQVRLLDPVTGSVRKDRAARIALGEPLQLRLVADGSVVDVYAVDVWLFSEHRPQPAQDTARIKLLRGRATVREVRLDRLETGNAKGIYGFNY